MLILKTVFASLLDGLERFTSPCVEPLTEIPLPLIAKIEPYFNLFQHITSLESAVVTLLDGNQVLVHQSPSSIANEMLNQDMPLIIFGSSNNATFVNPRVVDVDQLDDEWKLNHGGMERPALTASERSSNSSKTQQYKR